MRILVLGGCGAQGSFICRELVKHHKVSEVVSADINIKKAELFVSKYKHEKLSAARVDLGKVEELKKAVKGFDVVINAVSPIFNLRIMKACVENGASYQDLAFGQSIETEELLLEEAIQKELELDDGYKEIGVTALINTGMDPGISDIMAGYAADNLSHLYEARLKDVAILKSKEAVSTWSPSILWVDMTEEPIVYVDGEYKRVPPFSDEETYVFPEPMGPQPCYQHSHEEIVTFPLYFEDLRYLDFKMGGPDMPFFKSLYDYGLVKRDPIDVKGVKVSPLDVFLALTPPALTPDEIEKKIEERILEDEIAILLLDVKGERNGREVESTYYTMLTLKEANKRIPGVTATSYYVGMGCVALTELLIENKLQTKGVAPPEAYTEKERLYAIRRLADKGIEIQKIDRVMI